MMDSLILQQLNEDHDQDNTPLGLIAERPIHLVPVPRETTSILSVKGKKKKKNKTCHYNVIFLTFSVFVLSHLSSYSTHFHIMLRGL